eukprot:1530137-Alexandrium_andersonii.AAC.1
MGLARKARGPGRPGPGDIDPRRQVQRDREDVELQIAQLPQQQIKRTDGAPILDVCETQNVL